MTADPMRVLVVQLGPNDAGVIEALRGFVPPVEVAAVRSFQEAWSVPLDPASTALVVVDSHGVCRAPEVVEALSGSRAAPLTYFIADRPADEEAMLLANGVQAIIPTGRADRLPAQLHRDLLARRAAERLRDAVGDQFFRALVTELARSLGIPFVVVGQIDRATRTRVTTVAAWVRDSVVDPLSYHLDGTPCYDVSLGQSVFIAEEATHRYPACSVFAHLGVASYFGIPLYDSKGSVIGLLVLMNDQPMTQLASLRAATSLLTTRAGAELERMAAEQERDSLQTQLVAAQKMEAIGTLAGGVAHDFNNILMGILGNAEMAREDLETWHPAYPHLREIVAATHRAREVVQRILTFSRKREPRRRPVLLGSIIEELAVLLRASLPATISLRTAAADATSAVSADPDQVYQVLLNLATNAAHAIGERPGAISIVEQLVTVDGTQVNVGLDQGPYHRVTVSDNGSGMDAVTLGRIFEPFFTTKPPGQGTGLGLSVVHGIMKDHGGTVLVRSERGVGSAFELYFPVADLAPMPLRTAAGVPRGRGERILLVDDEAAIVRVGQRMLERMGYRVTAFTRASEAWALIQTDPQCCDLVISDYTMPEFTGTDMARMIHAVNPALPILLTTGNPDMLDIPVGSPVKGVLAKPFAASALARAIQGLLAPAPASTLG